MKSFFIIFLSFFCLTCKIATCQTVPIDKVNFFEDTSILNVTIETNMVKIFRESDKKNSKFPAFFSTTLPDGSQVKEPVVLETRGHFRKGFCYIPPIKVIFKNKKTSVFESLGSLKLVNQCKTSETYQQYLVSELLIYKMFNLLTDKSFRVRLINLKIVDTNGKKKTITENSFLIENEKNLASRNTCTQIKSKKIKYNATDRRQMTLVDIFEYMIGNTDWSVSEDHNIQFLHSDTDSLSLAYVVPYDFDCSGFVNADYAKPDPKLNISNVQERLYRGFPRTLDEINETLEIFKKQEKNIYAIITNCNLLNQKTKKDLKNYLDGFFTLIKNPEEVNYTFVRNARKD
ncbi:MAG: hypothetical protein ABI136_04205 [Ginsengibacter sp.]